MICKILTKRYASSSSLGSNTNSEPTNCYNALLKYLAHLGRRAKRRLWRQYKEYRKRNKRKRRAAALSVNEQSSSNNSNLKTNKIPIKTNHFDHRRHQQLVKKSSTSIDKNLKELKESDVGLETKQNQQPVKYTCIELQSIVPKDNNLKSGLTQKTANQSTVDKNEAKDDQLTIINNQQDNKQQRPLISCLRTNRTEHIICPIINEQQNVSNNLSIQTNSNLSTSHSANFIFQPNSSQVVRNTNHDQQSSFENHHHHQSSNQHHNVNSQQRCFNNFNSSTNQNFSVTTNLSNTMGNLAVLADGRRHGSVPTLYLRPNILETSNSSSNFLVSTLDGNLYLKPANSRRINDLNNINTNNNNLNSIKPPTQQFDQTLPSTTVNSLHWSTRPALIKSNETGLLEEEQLKFEKDDDSEDDEIEKEYENWINYIRQTWWYRLCAKIKRILQIIVDHRYFQRFIFLSILINTLSMGAEYHEQPPSLTAAVEYFNLFFTGIFMFEMILKILAHGCYIYISDGFNVFDGIVVIVR